MAVERFKILPRRVDRRDARLFVVACEGEKTEKIYLDSFAFERVVVKVLDAGVDGLSDSNQVLERLREFKNSLDKREEGDEFWLVLDIDHNLEGTHFVNFKEACRAARQAGFELAISHPCFELWLILHLQEMDANQSFKPSELKKMFRALFADYENRVAELNPALPFAIERAESMDFLPAEPWPNTTGTRMSRLMKAILKANIRPGRKPLAWME